MEQLIDPVSVNIKEKEKGKGRKKNQCVHLLLFINFLLLAHVKSEIYIVILNLVVDQKVRIRIINFR